MKLTACSAGMSASSESCIASTSDEIHAKRPSANCWTAEKAQNAPRRSIAPVPIWGGEGSINQSEVLAKPHASKGRSHIPAPPLRIEDIYIRAPDLTVTNRRCTYTGTRSNCV